MEEYKPILDYPNYEVSNFGNVRIIKTGKILKPWLNKTSYLMVRLSKNNQPVNKTIHRLVALAFLPNPDNKPEVDHIDRNRTNNVVDNLRWVTISENCLNTYRRDRDIFGITFHKRDNVYLVQIVVNKKQQYIGSRKTLEEAIILRDSVLNTQDSTRPSSEVQ